jgi:antitoxin HicB
MHYAYPYDLSPQPEGGFTVTFPDVPEAITQAETEAEVAGIAEDALVTALSFYTDKAEPLPHPSPAYGRRLAYVPVLVAVKLALHDAMLDAGVSNAVLSRRLGVDEKIVRRLRDPLHRSRIERVGEALRSLGQVIEVVINPVDGGGLRPRPIQAARPQFLCARTRMQSRSHPSTDRRFAGSGGADAQRKQNRQRVPGRSFAH